eukprot:gene3885-2756_t
MERRKIRIDEGNSNNTMQELDTQRCHLCTIIGLCSVALRPLIHTINNNSKRKRRKAKLCVACFMETKIIQLSVCFEALTSFRSFYPFTEWCRSSPHKKEETGKQTIYTKKKNAVFRGFYGEPIQLLSAGLCVCETQREEDGPHQKAV